MALNLGAFSLSSNGEVVIEIFYTVDGVFQQYLTKLVTRVSHNVLYASFFKTFELRSSFSHEAFFSEGNHNYFLFNSPPPKKRTDGEKRKQ